MTERRLLQDPDAAGWLDCSRLLCVRGADPYEEAWEQAAAGAGGAGAG